MGRRPPHEDLTAPILPPTVLHYPLVPLGPVGGWIVLLRPREPPVSSAAEMASARRPPRRSQRMNQPHRSSRHGLASTNPKRTATRAAGRLSFVTRRRRIRSIL